MYSTTIYIFCIQHNMLTCFICWIDLIAHNSSPPFFALYRVIFSCPDRGTKRCPGLVPPPGHLKMPQPGHKNMPRGHKKVPHSGHKKVPRPGHKNMPRGHKKVPRPGHKNMPRSGYKKVPRPGHKKVPRPGHKKVPPPDQSSGAGLIPSVHHATCDILAFIMSTSVESNDIHLYSSLACKSDITFLFSFRWWEFILVRNGSIIR